jgi:hypothetical protein
MDDGKKYPPKYVIAVAAKLATGNDVKFDEFNAVEAKGYFEARGYTIDTKQEKFELTITADSITSTDERFTMDNLYMGNNYKPIDAYFMRNSNEIIHRKRNKSEAKISNQTLPRLACQIFEKQIASWCDNIQDTNDTAIMANDILESGVDTISVPEEIVPFVWTCLEKSNVEIYTRYNFGVNDTDEDFNDLVKKINHVLKSGADGVQIFIKMENFMRFMDLLSLVRDDLFFGHKLCICMDINDIDISKWEMIFDKLRALRVDVFAISLEKDDGKRSDFMGRIYGMLNAWDFGGILHCIKINKNIRIDEIMRLTEMLQPDIYEKLRFFIEY